MKNLCKITLLLILSLLFEASCKKEQNFESINNKNEALKSEINYADIDSYLIEIHDLTKRMFLLKQKNATFEESARELDLSIQKQNYERSLRILKERFNLEKNYLDELSVQGNKLFEALNKTPSELRSLLEKRYEFLLKENIIDFSFTSESSSSGNHVVLRAPCWWIATYGIITATAAMAAGCSTGLGCAAATAYALATVVNTTIELCEQCGCNDG
ncbi:MAG TPA: hypothetical protein ENI82_00525 [Bacteroidetes bacterium]|nr:hypothetical protein [Bacteroidota bacterium]